MFAADFFDFFACPARGPSAGLSMIIISDSSADGHDQDAWADTQRHVAAAH
jgi:hypothetical protein